MDVLSGVATNSHLGGRVTKHALGGRGLKHKTDFHFEDVCALFVILLLLSLTLVKHDVCRNACNSEYRKVKFTPILVY